MFRKPRGLRPILSLIVPAAAVALALMAAPPAEACSITAAGTCGGSECPEGRTCTKVSDTECKCVKDSLLSLVAEDNACLEAVAAVNSLARRARGRSAPVGALNCLGDCLAKCREEHLSCIDLCREEHPGDPGCIDDCNRKRDTCDSSCFDSCSDGPAPEPLALTSAELDLSGEEVGAARSGGVIAVRIFFKVQGLGSFTAGVFDTAKGDTNAWIGPGLPLRLTAKPGPGHRFSHWLLNGQFASSDSPHTARTSRGLTITAVFERNSR